MKRKYLIKKDPAKEGQDNWVIMNTEQFLAWKKTPEGQLRYNNLGRLDACDEDDYIIYMECDEVTRVQWKKESDRRKYNLMCKKKSGIEILSYNAMTFDDEDINGEEILVDDNCNVEYEVIRKADIEMLHRALRTLRDDELDLIAALFLIDDPMSEREYAALHEMSCSWVHEKKTRTLKKLSKFFGNWTAQI